MPKPTPPFEFIDAPGIRINAPDQDGKPWDVIYIVLHTDERVLRVRNPYACNTLNGCYFFGNQYQPVGPIQLISQDGNSFAMTAHEVEDDNKAQRKLQYDIFDEHDV